MFPLPMLEVKSYYKKGVCRDVQQRIRLKIQKTVRVNKAIQSLNLLFFGGPNFKTPAPVGDLETLPLVQRDAIMNVIGKVNELGQPICASRSEALKVLRASEPSGYDVPDGISGSTVPMKLDSLSLPSRGTAGVDLVGNLQEPTRSIVDQFGTFMLRDADEWMPPSDEIDQMKPYNDPLLSTRDGYLAFVQRLFESGVLSFASGCKGRVGAFTVAKKPKIVNGTTIFRQRLVLDCRQTNCLFKPPPATHLGSLSALAESELPLNSSLFIAGADIRDCFYAVNMDPGLQEYFALASDLTDAELARVTGGEVAPGSGKNVPVISVLPMGFSWSFYLVQQLHTDTALQALGLTSRSLFLDGQPPPSLTNNNISIMPYCDNLHSISLSKDHCQVGKDAMASALEAIGFELHEHCEASDFFETLGGAIDGRKGVVRSSLKKMWHLIYAFELAAEEVVSVKTIQRLLGHAMVVSVLNRSGMSIFRKLYDFVASDCDPRKLHDSERNECIMFAGLVPLLVADLRRPWSSTVTCSDASPFGFGICECEVDPAISASHGRWLERWRFKRLPPSEWKPRVRSEGWDALWDVETVVGHKPDHASDEYVENIDFPEIPTSFMEPSKWKTVKMGKWEHTAEHITLKEARSLLLAVRRLSRNSQERGKKHLVLLDNMALCFAVAKGRAHSFDLLRVIQKISAISLACNLTVRTRWVRSEVNVADGPSRGFIHPGVAPSAREPAEPGSHDFKNSPEASADSCGSASRGIKIVGATGEERDQEEEASKENFGRSGKKGAVQTPKKCSSNPSARPRGQESPAEYDDCVGDQEREQRDPSSVLGLLPSVRGLLQGERHQVAPGQNGCRRSGGGLHGCPVPRQEVPIRRRENLSSSRILSIRPQGSHASKPKIIEGVEKVYAGAESPAASKGDLVWLVHEADGQRTGRDRSDGDHSLRPLPAPRGSCKPAVKEHCRPSSRSRRTVQADHSHHQGLRGRSSRQDRGFRQLAEVGQSSDKVDWRVPFAEGQEHQWSRRSHLQYADGDLQKGVRCSRKIVGHRPAAPVPAQARGGLRRFEQQAEGPPSRQVPREVEDRSECEALRKDWKNSAIAEQAHRQQLAVLPVVREELGKGFQRSDSCPDHLTHVESPCVFEDIFTMANRPRFFCLEIFAGTARLSTALKKAGVCCFPVDVCIFPSHNVLLSDIENSISHFIQSGRVKFVWLGMPCTTFSRARKHDGVGPGPLRSSEYLWGLPDLNVRDKKKLLQGNELFLFTLRILKLCDRLHIPFIIENPFSSMAWEVPSMRRFIQSSNCLECNLDFCMFGERWKKPTKLVYKYLCLDSLALRCNSSSHICSRTGQPHVPLKGVDGNGKFMTLVAQPYPWQMVASLASVLSKALRG